MGKYTATQAMRRDRKRAQEGHGDTFSDTVDYFTEVPKDESQYRLQEFLYGFDPTGLYRGFVDQRDLSNYWNDYLRHTGMSWNDVKYPSFMRGYGMSGTYYRSTLNFVSKNVDRLYR